MENHTALATPSLAIPLILLGLVCAGTVIAEESTTSIPDASGVEVKNRVLARVHGLVCDFCARAIEKVFGRLDEVSDIDVDLGIGTIVIDVKPGQCLEGSKVIELVGDAGYKTVSIEGACADNPQP